MRTRSTTARATTASRYHLLLAGTTYQAVFSTASMLQKGDDVRVAGVSVGEVKKVEHHDRTQALVTYAFAIAFPCSFHTSGLETKNWREAGFGDAAMSRPS